MDIKKCSLCNIEKEAIDQNFYKQKNGKFGLNSKCKECVKIENKKYRSNPGYKEKHRINQKLWVLKNPEKSKIINDKSRSIHGDKRNETRKIKYWSDPEFRAKKLSHHIAYKERRKEINSRPENIEKNRLRMRLKRQNEEYRQLDYQRTKEYSMLNRDILNKKHRERRFSLPNSYVAKILKVKESDVNKDILETKRLVILLKRELKSNNI